MRAIVIGLLLIAHGAHAQRRINSLGIEACAGVGLDIAKPAIVEWTTWLGIGSGKRDGDRVYAVRAGAAADFELGQIRNPWKLGGDFEVRWGPWIGAESTRETHTVEGGFSLDFGQTQLATSGTYTARLGVGVDDERRRTMSLTILGGVRYVPARHSRGGGCLDGWPSTSNVRISDPGRPRKTIARASGARVFATLREGFDSGKLWLVGIEFEPTWPLPPYSLGKLAGGRPGL
jgi:hypothetical protein